MPDTQYMDDAPESAVAPPGPEPAADDSGGEDAADESTGEEGATALLPKSFFPQEPQPGSKYTVDVVRVHDDQVECKLEGAEEEEPPAEEAPEAAPAAAPEPMME